MCDDRFIWDSGVTPYHPFQYEIKRLHHEADENTCVPGIGHKPFEPMLVIESGKTIKKWHDEKKEFVCSSLGLPIDDYDKAVGRIAGKLLKSQFEATEPKPPKKQKTFVPLREIYWIKKIIESCQKNQISNLKIDKFLETLELARLAGGLDLITQTLRAITSDNWLRVINEAGTLSAQEFEDKTKCVYDVPEFLMPLATVSITTPGRAIGKVEVLLWFLLREKITIGEKKSGADINVPFLRKLIQCKFFTNPNTQVRFSEKLRIKDLENNAFTQKEKNENFCRLIPENLHLVGLLNHKIYCISRQDIDVITSKDRVKIGLSKTFFQSLGTINHVQENTNHIVRMCSSEDNQRDASHPPSETLPEQGLLGNPQGTHQPGRIGDGLRDSGNDGGIGSHSQTDAPALVSEMPLPQREEDGRFFPCETRIG